MQCTDVVVLYNKYMVGVDKGDQLRQYYCVKARCQKPYKYMFWFLFDVAVTNSFILSLFTPTTIPLTHQHLKTFRLQPAEQLVGTYNSCKCLGRPCSRPIHHPPSLPSITPSQSTRTALHLPSHVEKRRWCMYCSQFRTSSKRSDVIWYCKECPGQPALCLTGNEDGSDCFSLVACTYHVTLYFHHLFHAHAHTYTHAHTNAHTHMHTYTHAHTCTHTHTHTHTHAHTCMHTHTNTNTNTHMHAHHSLTFLFIFLFLIFCVLHVFVCKCTCVCACVCNVPCVFWESGMLKKWWQYVHKHVGGLNLQ